MSVRSATQLTTLTDVCLLFDVSRGFLSATQAVRDKSFRENSKLESTIFKCTILATITIAFCPILDTVGYHLHSIRF